MITSGRPSGIIELEGCLHLPGVPLEAPGAVLCHPHPAGGGEMGVGLIRLLAGELAARGMVALRFNFGGVGMSGGSFTDGLDEPVDVAAAVEYLRALPEVDAGRVSVAGWSFGAWMALMALTEGLPAEACVAVAPPLVALDWQDQAPRIAGSSTVRYYVVGDGDQFCSSDELMEFASAISPGDAANVRIITGADHFFFARESEVVKAVIESLAA